MEQAADTLVADTINTKLLHEHVDVVEPTTTTTLIDENYLNIVSSIDWILVKKSSTFSNWNYIRAFEGNRCIVDALSEQHYFDRSSHRVGQSILDSDANKKADATTNFDDKITSTKNSAVSTKKRKRSDDELLQIKYIDNDENVIQYVDLRQLLPIYNTNCVSIQRKDSDPLNNIPILVTNTTDIFRLLATSQIHSPLSIASNCTNDEPTACIDTNTIAVLEIGTSTGMTSEVIWQQLDQRRRRQQQKIKQDSNCYDRWFGIDTGADMVQAVQNKLRQHIESNNLNSTKDAEWAVCHHIDPLLDPDTASTLVRRHFCSKIGRIENTELIRKTPITVLIDIGGNREESGVLRMIDWVLRTFQHQKVVPSTSSRDELYLYQIIIKSESLYSLLVSNRDSMENKSNDTPFDNVTSKGWYLTRLRSALRTSIPKHPLQAPKRFVPSIQNISNDEEHEERPINQLICRYHNYYKKGCAKIVQGNATTGTAACPYNHDHCHICLTIGHIARTCPLVFGTPGNP